MKDPETIIDEYRDSDPEAQLHLFLDNPSLRNSFIEVESDSAVLTKGGAPHTTPSPAG